MDTPERIDIAAALPHRERLGARRAGDFWFKHVEKFIGDPSPFRLILAKDTYVAARKVARNAKFKEILLFALTHITGF